MFYKKFNTNKILCELKTNNLEVLQDFLIKMSKIKPLIAKLLLENPVTKLATTVIASSKTNYSTKSAQFEASPYKLYKLDKGPETSATLTHEEALALYEKLVVIRRLENAVANLYKEKVIRGFCHLYIGQEAVAVGMHSVMREADTAITSYRCHAWNYLMGVSAHALIAELAFRQTGTSRGKGGSMHLYGKGFYGGNGIVGAQVSLGAGIALAHKYNNNGAVSVALYGDGAANQGQVFESFNFAKLWNLPCIFVCENNIYGMGTSANRSSANTQYYTRGDYIPGIWVDGMDIIATREATRFAIDYCTSGKGPILLEMETYRYVGHSMSDPGTSYRSRDEIQQVRKTRDPITSFKKDITSKSLVTPDQIKEIDAKVRKEIDDAIEKIKTDPETPIEELTADIYCKNLSKKIRGVHPKSLFSHLEIHPRK